MESIFKKIDSHDRSFLGFNPLFALKNVSAWRKYFALCVVVSGALWGAFGWDSCWSQLKPFGENIIPLLTGKISLRSVWEMCRQFYGIGNHFSAPVIYGLSFITLSLYLEKVEIKKSLNFISSTAFSLASIGVFELTWNFLFAHFQTQPWTFTFVPEQSYLLIMFTVFVTVGGLMFLCLYAEGYKPNLGHRSLIFLVAAVSSWILWVNYPLPIEQLQVQTTTGMWTSTNKFPQTSFAVDIDPTDGVAIGELYWVENDILHGVNNLAKVLTTLAILSICSVKKSIKFNIDQHHLFNLDMERGGNR